VRDRAQLLRALLVLGLGGFFFILFVGVPVLGKILDFPVRLEFFVSLFFLVVGTAVIFVVGRRRPPGTPLTWGEALIAATFVFGVMLVGYGVVPNEWLM